jgi:hypothetical protein
MPPRLGLLLCIVGGVLGLLAGATLSRDEAFQRGLQAYNRGDYATAVGEWQPLAAQGEPRAQSWLGQMYERGQGVVANVETALHWYQQAATQGYAPAQYALGVYYANGNAVRKDEAEAVRWYTQAAAQGDPHAQYALGRMYHEGRGVEKDATKAVHWYDQAATQGKTDAQSVLAEMYREGHGDVQQLTAAERWYAQRYNTLPTDVRGVLAGAQQLELLELNPHDVVRDKHEVDGYFRGYKILKRTSVPHAAQRQQFVEAFVQAMDRGKDGFGKPRTCLRGPEYGARLRHATDLVDLVISFYCTEFDVYNAGGEVLKKLRVSRLLEPMFHELMHNSASTRGPILGDRHRKVYH